MQADYVKITPSSAGHAEVIRTRECSAEAMLNMEDWK